MANYARAEKLVCFGLAALSCKLADSEDGQIGVTAQLQLLF